MNKWFTKLALALLPSFVVSFAPANADYDAYDACNPCYDPCGSCRDWCGGFEIGADFIYWKPCIDDLDYALQFAEPLTGGVGVGSYKFVDPGWEPGFRVYVGIEDICGGMGLIGSYTWINVKERSSIEGAPASTLYSTLFHSIGDVGAAGFASLASGYRLNYQTFDVLFASECCLCNHFFKPFFGVTGVFLDQEIDSSGTEINGAVDSLRWRSDYWGIGLKLGTEYKYAFCDGFGFFASASGAVVAGESDTYRTEFNDIAEGSVTVNFNGDDTQCQVLNGYHFAGGFLYEDCWCDWDFSVRFGYEFVKWTNVTNLRRYTSDATSQVGTSASSNTTTLGFHGIFAGLSVSF